MRNEVTGGGRKDNFLGFKTEEKNEELIIVNVKITHKYRKKLLYSFQTLMYVMDICKNTKLFLVLLCDSRQCVSCYQLLHIFDIRLFCVCKVEY